MIIRIIAVDPRPRPNEGDLRVYQVPENSREQLFLQELFEHAGIEYAVIESTPKVPAKRRLTRKGE